MSYNDRDREVRAAAATLADELIPFEVQAEMSGAISRRRSRSATGPGPRTRPHRHQHAPGTRRRRPDGLPAGPGPGEIGRVTNALGWVVTTPAGWLPEVAAEHQLETWVKPTILGERHECYAVTEEHAGSDTDAIRATARRDGDGYVLNGEKWHVTRLQRGRPHLLPGEAHRGLAWASALFIVDVDTPGVRHVRTPEYSHTYRDEHAVVAFEDVRVPAENLVGQEGDGMRYTYAWFRYERLGDRRPVVRRRRAADRRGIQVRRRARGLRPGPDRVPGRDLPWPTRSPSCGRSSPDDVRTAQEMDEGADSSWATRTARWPSCSRPRWPTAWRTGPSRSSAAAATCGRTWPSGFSGSCAVDRIWEGTSEISG